MHDSHNDSGDQPTGVLDGDVARPAHMHSRARAAANRRAAMLMAATLKGRASSHQIGDRLDVCPSRAIKIIRGDAPWTVGDLLLLREGDALAVLEALRAEIESPTRMPIERRQRLVSMRAGDLSRAVDSALLDGRVDAVEAVEIRQHAIGLSGECRGAIRDVGAE
jgi:hypothetical protein